MSRMWIVVGDITSSGGKVITGSPFTDIDGMSVSRIGDKATCPLHKGVFPIVDGDYTNIIDDHPVALHGSKLACGCTVLAVQQTHVFVGQESAAGVAVMGGAAAFAGASSSGYGAAESDTLHMSDQGRFAGSASKRRLRIGSVLKVLCPQDKAVVDELARTDVRVADDVVFEDAYHDGSKWTTRPFEAGGFQDSEHNKIVLLDGTSPEDAATTLYHEVYHKGQDRSVPWLDREIEAYTKTEQWAIEKGLPGQGGLRKKGDDGGWIPDSDAIRRVVGDYPITETKHGELRALRRMPDGSVLLENGTTRAPRKGDTFPAKEPAMKGEKAIPPSAWKCPGDAEENPPNPAAP